jgi:predicted DNA-binding protein (MmcQ/YjbR family)
MTKTNRHDPAAAEDLFDQIVPAYLGKPQVNLGKAFHNDVLKVNDKIFAMVVRGQLVVKVRADQAAALIAAGDAVAFEPRKGRKMKEWIAVDPPRSCTDRGWERLVADAYGYVAALPKATRTRSKSR